LTLLERKVVDVMPVSRIEATRRHFSFNDGGFHCFGPRTRGLVIEKRHRRNFAWTVTALTPGLQNRENIFIKGRALTERGRGEQNKRLLNQPPRLRRFGGSATFY